MYLLLLKFSTCYNFVVTKYLYIAFAWPILEPFWLLKIFCTIPSLHYIVDLEVI